jgi:O-methyltransferase involved in polyketide biosynthesis
VPLGVNFELDDVGECLRSGGFDADAPSFIVFEGASMYLDRQTNGRILASLASLARPSESRVWVDVVAESVVAGTSGVPEVEAFIAGMAQLGEPFTFGLDDTREFFGSCGLALQRCEPSSVYLSGPHHPIFDLYRFCLLGAPTRPHA